MALLIRLGSSLNNYANLILAFFTLVYVWLTYQMLSSLRHQSLRDNRIRHLQDIKSEVAEPILAWFEKVALPMLSGDLPFVSTMHVKTVRPSTKFGESQHSFELRVVRSPVEFPKMGHLFFHAELTHFGLQLSSVDDFKTDFEELSQEYLSLADVCVNEIAKTAPLPRLLAVAHNSEEFADNCHIVAQSLTCLVRREWPELRREENLLSPPGGMLLRAQSSNSVIAIGSREHVEKWAEVSRQIIEKRWNISDLESKTRKLLSRARLVRELVSRIPLTYDLHGDCEYVGGRQAGPLTRLWRLLAGRLRPRSLDGTRRALKGD